MKNMKKFAFLLSAVMFCGMLTACADKNQTITENVCELSYYDGTYREELDDKNRPQFNKELWRLSDISVGIADPMILDDTANTGYYYAYGTGFIYYYSDNLEDWFYGGNFVSLPAELNGSQAHWAPEVIYDPDDEVYYAFFTLTPPADNKYESTPGVAYLSMAAISQSPGGPFIPVDFSDGVRELDAAAYPQFYAKYALLDSAAHQAAFEKEGLPVDTGYKRIFSIDGGYADGGWVRCIDFHPYLDPDTGEKYLFWSQSPGSIAGVRMIDWLTPDWDSYKTLTACLYDTIDNYKKAMGGEPVEKVYYEDAASYCNEGPFMYKHNGKYYLTFSIGAYFESSYGVMQAVADSPLGDFRKLSDSENGMLLNNDIGNHEAIAGPGHHSFVTVRSNGQNRLFIAYHAHNNPKVFTDRHTQLDEVKWITVRDVNGNQLDVMHVNGPTVTVQPSFGIGKAYGDVSRLLTEAKMIRGSFGGGSSASSLIDGAIPFYTRVNKSFVDTYVRETTITATSTFELTLSQAHEIRGIMFYNSRLNENAFQRIKDIAFICEENGEEKIYLIRELNVDREASYLYNRNNEQYRIVRGSSCYAEFNAINVKAIRFTVELPEGQNAAGIAEVALVGSLG